MYNWRNVKLGDVIEIIGGGTPKRNCDEYWNGDIPWLSVIDFNNDRRYVYDSSEYITNKGLKESSTNLLHKGQIIISARGTVGALSQISRPMAFNQSCYGITSKDENCVNDFLYYLLKYTVPKIKMITHGSVFDTITKDTFKRIEVMLPPFDVQKLIANILSSFDDKIELNNRINANLEEQAQILFRRWFVDFEFPNDEGRPYKSNGGKFVNSELGSIPEGWSVKAIADVAELMAGGDKPCIVTKKPTGECNVPIFSNGMSDDGLYGYTTNAKVFKESVTISARGTIGFVRLRQKPFFPIVRLITAIPNTSLISAKYLYFLLLDKNISGTGTTQQQLTVPDFRRYELIVPTLNIIKNFNNITNVVFNKITFLKHENEILESLRDAILPKLMNNELRP